MIADSLAIDIKDPPLKPCSSPNGTLHETLSGSVYCEAYNRYIRKPSSQLFVPIIQVHNVFNEIEFGDPEREIVGATPI